jgi:hypothetical protein
VAVNNDPPAEGGWWDSFLDGAHDFLFGPIPGGNPLKRTYDAANSFAQGLESDLKAEGKRALENPRDWYLEQVGAGNLIGGVAAKSARPVISRLVKALQSEGGATLEATGRAFKGSGYAVADPALTTIVSGEEEMRAFLKRPDVRDAIAAGKRIGKWTDPETGKTEINISDILADVERAQALATERGEKAFGHLGKGGAYQGDIPTARKPVTPSVEKVDKAVIRDPESGAHFEGSSHADAGMNAGPLEDHAWDLLDRTEDNGGFSTNHRSFVSRAEAAKIAKAQQQIQYPETFGDDPTTHNVDLMSEDLKAPAVQTRETWRPRERGVFDRAPERGVPATEYREPAPLPFESAPRPTAGPSALAEQIAHDPRVEQRIVSDMEKGLDLGGRGWYGTLPLKRYFESIGDPQGFIDFNLAGGAGSIRTPTHNELTNLSLLRYARKRGLPYEEARQEFFRRHPGTMKPTFMGVHGKVYDRALAAGNKMVPSSPSAGELKVPHYTHDRLLGANGVPLDTHELRAMAQALGLDEDMVRNAAVDAESYNLMTQPYRRVAQRYGLHPDQVQAGRWIGGGKQTGLKSQPQGDFMQTLEDGLLYTARTTGRDESPKGLRSLWDAIAAGDEFFMPFGGEGGFPVR